MGRKAEKFTKSFEHAFMQAQEDWESLRDDIRESADAMEETFPGSERTESYNYAADELDGVDLELDLPAWTEGLTLTYIQDTRKGQPKQVRLENLASLLEDLYNAAAGEAPDDQEDEDEALLDGLEQAKSTVESIEL